MNESNKVKGVRKRKVNLIQEENLELNQITNKDGKLNVDAKSNVEAKREYNLISFLDDISILVAELETIGNKGYENHKFRDIQFKIETEWVDKIKEKINEPNLLNHKLTTIIYKAFESLEIFSKNKKQIHKNFPTLEDSIINIDSIIISFSKLMTYLGNKKTKTGYNYLSGIIGKSIISHIFYKNEIQNNENSSYLEDYNTWLKKNNIDDIKFVLLGDILIERFIDIEMVTRTYNIEDEKSYLDLNKTYIEDLANTLIISPPSLPMVCKPNVWSDEKFGGFLKNRYQKREIITGSTFKHGHKIENREKLYNAINYLNKIRFGVNNEFLNYLNNNGKFLIDYLISEELNLIPETDRNYNKKLNSIKLKINMTLNIAKIFSKIPFYLTTNSDWRGRIYTNSFFLTYQGSDISNCLIQFWEGESLSKQGLEYLFIYGANSYNENGINKKSNFERINWVNKNYNKILEMDKDYILKAESPFVFANFCLIMNKLHLNPNEKVFTPIFLDATCSGIQHFAGLLQDFELGSRVNLIPQENTDEVGDIYSFILEPLNEAINNYGKENIEFSHFTNLNFTRKILKLSIMTKIYNVTIFGMKEQLKSNFEKSILNTGSSIFNPNSSILDFTTQLEQQLPKIENVEGENKKIFYKAPCKNGFVYLSNRDIYKIAQIINDKIFILFPSLKEIYDYLIQISKFLTISKLPLTWTTPAGLQITQHYLKSDVYKTSIKSGQVGKTIVLRKTNKDKKDNNKQRQAIIPNIIHSLDASHLINIINTAIDINLNPIITIHDCFGTHPNKMGNLHQLVLKEFIFLYTNEDFLKKFHMQIIESIKDNNYIIYTSTYEGKEEQYILIDDDKLIIPELPEKGTLNLDSISKSKYLIT